MKRLYLFVIVLATIVAVGVVTEENNTAPIQYEVPVAIKADIARLKQLLQAHENDRAMPLIDSLLQETDDNAGSLRAWLFTRQAHIYQQRRHFHHAIASLSQANRYLENRHHHDDHIQRLQRVIDQMQQERNLNDVYRYARNTGMAKQLRQRVTIAYVYLDDKQWSKWSGKARLQNQFNIELVTKWYKQQAAIYDIDDLDLDVRYFLIKSPNGIAGEWLRSPTFFNQAQSLLTQQLGYQNFRQFSEAITQGDLNHQLALVFHANHQARSFANVCHNHCHAEYVMLTEKMNNNPFAWATPQVQSHEILHLFGAMDLYNIRKAKDYAVTDLMNYYSQALKYATIEPITAWAVGWQTTLPRTPFKVDDRKD